MDRIQSHICVLVGCCDKVGDLPPLNEAKRMQPIGLLLPGCLLVLNRDLMLGQQCSWTASSTAGSIFGGTKGRAGDT